MAAARAAKREARGRGEPDPRSNGHGNVPRGRPASGQRGKADEGDRAGRDSGRPPLTTLDVTSETLWQELAKPPLAQLEAGDGDLVAATKRVAICTETILKLRGTGKGGGDDQLGELRAMFNGLVEETTA
jgi:hypothetical protein